MEIFRPRKLRTAPSDMVTIDSIGLFWGYNDVKFICKNNDAEYETTYAFYNSSLENVEVCNIDHSDNDGDTISNYLESLWGTNIDLADTDEDGMDDYQELYVLHTDPLSADFNSNGVSDFEEDTDFDGIKSMDEILIYQTNPFSSDTDNDGLNDNDELFTYNTNPLLADTDGDGLHDGNEVHHKYDPLTANATFEITKAETSGGVTAQGLDVLSEIVYLPNSSPTTYTLESGTDITLGAAGNSSIYDFNQADSFYLSTYGEWENAGLWYNLEAYKYHIKYARYSPNSCVDYELKQIDFLTLESELYNTGYHGLINNCSSVAENVWNAVVSDDRKVDAKLLPFIETPYSLKDNIEASFTDYYSYDLSSLKLAIKK